MIGESVGNHRILSKIGQGGMGTVYEAQDTQLGRRVAIKILNPSLVSNSKELARFRAEAKVQANLNHPNIVTLHEFEPYKDSYYMVMEFVVGRNLAEIVKAVGALPAHIVVTITKQVLDGLSVAHRSWVVHRDLKPSNIMLTPDGVAKVMDFGIAKVQGSKSLTATGALVGTVSYMSPEQVRGEEVDARSDIYSLGIILFELLTGRVPFKEDSDFSVMMHHVGTPPPPPTQFLPEIPGDLEDIVMRCLEKDPAARFQNVDQVLRPLEDFEEQERALGRGQLYTRRMLAQWLSGTGPQPLRTAADAPPPIAGGTATPRLYLANSYEAVPTGSTAPPNGKTFLIFAICFLALAGAATAYVFYKHGIAILSLGSGSPKPQVTQARVIPPNTEPAAQPVLQNPEAPSASGTQVPPGVPASGTAPPSVSPSRNAPPADGASTAGANVAGPSSTSGGATGSARQRTGSSSLNAPSTTVPPKNTPATMGSRAGFLIFVDSDQSGEKLPLGSAQSRAAEIVRQSGHEVLSGGAVSADVRSALDRGDLAQARRLGVGYVVLGSAHGSLEAQNAYGSTYYAGNVRIRFELVRMSDGRVAATGSSTAKSRGTADPEEALANALLNATSEATREMLRQFR